METLGPQVKETPAANVLIIDDDDMFCEMLTDMVQDMGHGVKHAQTLGDGLLAAASGIFDVVFLDVRMPDGIGLEVLPKLRELPSSPEVIIVTGAGDPDGAELAIVNGAWDYIEKQSSIKKMTLAMTPALQYRLEKKGLKPMKALKLEGIVGTSPQMRGCYDLLAQAADTDANVLPFCERGGRHYSHAPGSPAVPPHLRGARSIHSDISAWITPGSPGRC